MPQYFYTRPAASSTLALYQLSIRVAGGFSQLLPNYNFIFPLTPRSVRKESPSLTSIYDVAGPPSLQGVQRISDEFGLAPPIFTITGTTGWKYHSADGFMWNGQASCTRLESIINTYHKLNQQQIATRKPDLYTLEFYDFFRGEFWVVTPIGGVVIEQSEDRPLLSNYVFRLAARKKVAAPVTALAEDTVLNALAISAAAGPSAAVATFSNAALAASTLVVSDAGDIIDQFSGVGNFL